MKDIKVSILISFFREHYNINIKVRCDDVLVVRSSFLFQEALEERLTAIRDVYSTSVYSRRINQVIHILQDIH